MPAQDGAPTERSAGPELTFRLFADFRLKGGEDAWQSVYDRAGDVLLSLVDKMDAVSAVSVGEAADWRNDMDTVLTIAQSGLGTAEGLLKRKAAREKNAAKKRKLQKTAAALRAANDAISSLLDDEAFAGE